MGRKRIIIEVLAVLLICSAALVYVFNKDLRVETNLCIYAKFTQRDSLHLLVNESKTLRATVSGKFREIQFPMPRQSIKSLRLGPGDKPGMLIIKSIKIKTPLQTYQWPADKLSQFIKMDDPKSAAKNVVRRDKKRLLVRFPVDEPGILLPLNDEFPHRLNRLSQSRIFFIVVIPLLGLCLFYVIHFITWRSLRIFGSLKIFSNTVLIFLLILLFPLCDQFFGIVDHFNLTPLHEKRYRPAKPKFNIDDLSRYTRLYTSNYNDFFALRPLYIPLNNYFHILLFGVSPIPNVIVGKKGWLYMERQSEQVNQMDYYRALSLFTDEELEHWRKALIARRDWLAARGIHYLFIFVPNKSTIYPEYLPSNIRKARQRNRLDQLVEYLEKNSDLPILDLRKAIFTVKKKNPDVLLYRITDTHWNEYGAYWGYHEIIKTLRSKYFPQLEPVDISRYRVYTVERSGGDLAIMLSLQESLYRERVVEVERRFTSSVQVGKQLGKKLPGIDQALVECPGAELSTALVIHDSFFYRLKPYFSEHFRQVVYRRDWGLRFNTGLIKRVKPIIVIEQMAERFLLNKRLEFPPAK